MCRTWLVRHGRPLIDPSAPAHTWPLDPAHADGVRALVARLPSGAHYYSSPEPKALDTARLLTGGQVTVVTDLREHERRSSDWIEDFAGVVRRAFAVPHESAHPGWEALEHCRRRVVTAAARIRDRHRHDEVVLVGHGTAWTLLAAALREEEPDLDQWERLDLPDVIVI